jgi:hypothetical protein
LSSIAHAAALATAQGISVELVCAVFAEDEAYVAKEPVRKTQLHAHASRNKTSERPSCLKTKGRARLRYFCG